MLKQACNKKWQLFNPVILWSLLIFLLQNHPCFAQKKPVMNALNRFEINQKDTIYRFYAVIPPKKLKFDFTRNYYGFTKDTIIITQGAVAERILHGSFTVYFPDKNLKEAGKFNYGLKSGEWKWWFPDGQLKQITNWKDGEMDGVIEEYNFDGSKTKSGYYKNSLFTGYIIEGSSDGKNKKLIYKKGQVKEDK